MKTQLSILALCLAAGCAHGKAGSEGAESAARDERARETAHVKGRAKQAPGEAPVAQRTPESPSDAEHERVDVPSARRREELASRDGTLPEPRDGAKPASDYGADPANTRVNERDRDDQTLTPLDQGESTSDRDITQRIRKAVIADDALSFTAKNVKIITRDGRVTLRGPVNSAQERTSIERAASTVAGPGKVVNQLEVSKD
ncbi:MAG: BON domain-containing protein [Polyangiales bacterium]